MPRSTTIVMLTGFLILLLAAPAIFQVYAGTQGAVSDDAEDIMISGV